MNLLASSRKPHVATNLPSRHLKAEKIWRLRQLNATDEPVRPLEVGCGSGGISHWFATHPSLHCVVTAVDAVDSRQAHDGYTYQTVQGVELPFNDEQFDIVITNHVIEHVGDATVQLGHLKEIRRVLAPAGVGYLAVPNRWMMTESHYRIGFLSWLPRPWRSPCLRWRGKGDFYDCEPLEMGELEGLLQSANLAYENISIAGARAVFDIEHPRKWSTRLLSATPDPLLLPLKSIIPTLIYRLGKQPTGE